MQLNWVAGRSQSDSRLLTYDDIKDLSDAERCVAWNEIIANANGYCFRNAGLRGYFNHKCSWYSPNSSADAGGGLSGDDVRMKNVTFLQENTDEWYRYNLLLD